MDLQKAIDQISNNNAGEGMEAQNGGEVAPAEAAPVAETETMGIGSMEDSVSASINQAISNVGMGAENVETPAAETAPMGGAMPVETAAVGATPEVAPVTAEATMATPEVSGDFQSVRKEAIDALLPILGQTDLEASEKFGIYKEAASGGNRNQAVISGMVEAAKGIPNEKEKAEALLAAIRIIDGK